MRPGARVVLARSQRSSPDPCGSAGSVPRRRRRPGAVDVDVSGPYSTNHHRMRDAGACTRDSAVGGRGREELIVSILQRGAMTLLGGVLLASCTLGPNYKRPVVQTPSQFRYTAGTTDAQ